MILEQETFEKFGYHSWDLSHKSNKKVVCQCPRCGNIRNLCKHQAIKVKNCKFCCNKKQHNYCQDCGKEVNCLTTKICKSCYTKRRRKNISCCVDCGKKLTKQSSTRCWECWKKLHPDRFCIGCGKRLVSKKQKRCKTCHTKLQRKNKLKVCCVVCGKTLKTRDKNTKRCWKCYIKTKEVSKETKKKYRNHMKKQWKINKNEIVKKIMKGLQLKPNKPEKILSQLCLILFNRDYKYVGDGQVILEGFNPDFINVNGQKKIIELYGNYWHNKADYKERDKRRLKSYTRLGYKTLIIWEHELKDLDYVAGKLISFHEDL